MDTTDRAQSTCRSDKEKKNPKRRGCHRLFRRKERAKKENSSRFVFCSLAVSGFPRPCFLLRNSHSASLTLPSRVALASALVNLQRRRFNKKKEKKVVLSFSFFFPSVPSRVFREARRPFAVSSACVPLRWSRRISEHEFVVLRRC